MVFVKRQKGETEDRLIARFKKKVLSEKILIDYRERERYKSPSERRKEKKYRIEHLRELEKKRSY
ncbi:30S ribosomal protein S21 [Candidatus Woesebacteria bacterium RIFCSPLOWO2_01_FULL_39_21]|uniref:Small ribosomal subunit protein bS21 n=1 Tax=Candidatus Woesebacteria bacterium RIFCSPLOWO2_01_FULL_39_21 TaxID=1802519 RepID=A0A1F8BMD4_9BACT|nr:MAG: 30S ribosomal protein S21 [Candidatus Woesebacteria bacterium RIFCSPHIGHO2_01_FULL_39_23]OGM65226.1 MAG: 30S ribosomal protein S21 [Candidatus Woesebacteria bacterium RIFCSPLOWO2_01_FULL_39_21]